MTEKVEILLIEDNQYEAELTIRSLKKNNLTNNILHIDNGEEALDYLFSRGEYENMATSQSLQLILLDLKLPKVDGLEILRQIKSNEKTRLIPVVLLTSSSEEKDIIEGYKSGVNSYIVKPVSFEEFVRVVASLGMYWMMLNQKSVNKR